MDISSLQPPTLDATGVCDQATGLRRLFEGRPTRALAVVSNPGVVGSGLLIEYLIGALRAVGHRPLVIDAAETAREPDEWAALDLRWAIDTRNDDFAYLGARGLLQKQLDERGRGRAFLRRAAEASPESDVLLVHAAAPDLARLFAGHDWRPLLLVDTQAQSAVQAYASLKSLARCGLSTFDVLLDAARSPVLGPRVALRLADSASRFLSWPLGAAVVVQAGEVDDPAVMPRLQDLVRAQLEQSLTCAVHRLCAPTPHTAH